MNIKTNITLLLFFLIVFSSCITEGEELCPTGEVKVHLFAEKFQNKSKNPLDNREEKFCDRISHLRYYLYQDKKLVREGIVQEFVDKESNCYSLDFKELEYGTYELLIIGNSSKTALLGDPVQSANMYLAYPGCLDTEDFFTSVFSFNVNTEDLKEYEVGMLRAHGVIRYSFVNMPPEATKMQIVMENVTGEKWITGNYMNVYKASNDYVITAPLRQSQENNYVMGTFPTVENERSAYSLHLFREGEDTPFISEMISDDVNIERNQLVDITAVFNDGTIDFFIEINNEWDGWNPGGSGNIE
ncbi:MAG: hypothetical protein LIO93_10360 [Bacteroidales bacterium]|nr:hypothetical protein [Bacteroidales bacterium]